MEPITRVRVRERAAMPVVAVTLTIVNTPYMTQNWSNAEPMEMVWSANMAYHVESTTPEYAAKLSLCF